MYSPLSMTGSAARMKLLNKVTTPLEEPAVCEACPVSHYCPRADYADLVAGGLDSTKEFSVCSDIRDNVFYLMSLGQRGAALTRTILGQ